MNFWITFWTIFLIASLLLFATLAVVVSIGGYFNIKSLFKNIAAQQNKQNQSTEQ